MAANLRFYLDENVEIVIAEQLIRHGIEVVTVRSLDLLGDDDISHLQRATQMGYVLCTYDSDYVVLAANGLEHAGIIIAHPRKVTIGDWVRALIDYVDIYSSDDMRNRVEYL